MRGINICMLLFCAVVLTGFRAALAAPPTDFDKRAAAAMFAGKLGKDVDIASVDEAAMKGLKRVQKDAAKKTAQYILEFGGVDASTGADSRGFYRIGVGEELPPPGKGWTPIVKKPKEAGEAEVWIKPVESEADRFKEIAVRQKIGAITLLVRQRRPVNETPEAGALELAKRYATFLDFAKRYGVLMGRLRLLLISRPDQPDLMETPLNISLSDVEERELTIRALVVDNEGNAMSNLKKMSFKLAGPLAKFATVKVADREIAPPNATQKFDVNDPKSHVDLLVILPKRDAKIAQEVVDAFAAGAQPLQFKCSVTFK